MFDKAERNLDLESDKITSDPKGKMMSQKLETPQTTDRPKQIDPLKMGESSNSTGASDLLAYLQKMKTEEQELLEQKQRLVATEQSLHSKLVSEVEKKKTAINTLRAEVLNRANKCKELSQALGEPASETYIA
jgi:hypothetical protein